MSKYIMRLDDAADRMCLENWKRMERLLDYYCINPLVGVIPACKDPEMKMYVHNPYFWDIVNTWKNKGWVIALHGYMHVYCTDDGGINPINLRSEFAGISLDEQQKKIRSGIEIFRNYGIDPKVFFAPSHTFDLNTIQALKDESNIRIISDTLANKPYQKYGLTFVPQQSGRVRKLPFYLTTFCYHPNTMDDNDFVVLEMFLKQNYRKFVDFPLEQVLRKKSLYDKTLEKIYFARRR